MPTPVVTTEPPRLPGLPYTTTNTSVHNEGKSCIHGNRPAINNFVSMLSYEQAGYKPRTQECQRHSNLIAKLLMIDAL